MTNLLIQAIQKQNLKKMPEIKPGMTVRVHQKIKEGEKERVQIFEGLVISVSPGNGTNKMITVRKIVEGVGVEKVFPVYSPSIVKIEVKKTSKIRRAKLYYMRERSGKSARLRGRFLSDSEKAANQGQATEEELKASAEELAAKVEAEEAKKAQEQGDAPKAE